MRVFHTFSLAPHRSVCVCVCAVYKRFECVFETADCVRDDQFLLTIAVWYAIHSLLDLECVLVVAVADIVVVVIVVRWESQAKRQKIYYA